MGITTSRCGLLVLFYFLLFLVDIEGNPRNQDIGNKRYPTKTLQCNSFLTKPDGKLICPEARMSWCVKEVSPDLNQNLCGGTQYYGDKYVGGQCVFKKCAAECVEGTYSFEFDGQTYARERYCCRDKNFCNSAWRRSHGIIQPLLLLVLFVVGYLWYA